MAVTPSDEGYFTKKGVIRSDSFRATRDAPRAPASGSAADVQNTAASATASGIAQAAVVKIGGRMNVGNTGFDSGVGAMVQQAVASGLQNQAARKNGGAPPAQAPSGNQNQSPAAPQAAAPRTAAQSAAASQPAAASESSKAKVKGGSYQNSLIAAEKERQAKAAAPPPQAQGQSGAGQPAGAPQPPGQGAGPPAGVPGNGQPAAKSVDTVA